MAYLAYVRNGDDIPSLSGAKHLLGINEEGTVASQVTEQLMQSLTGFQDVTLANDAVQHLISSYPEVEFFSDEDAFKNFVRTNFLRDIEVTAHDIGLAFKNAVLIKPGEYRQDRLLHELGHIYYDSLSGDNRVKQQLRELFAREGMPMDEVDEQVVDAIGIMAHDHADQFFNPTFFGKLQSLLKRFWMAVKQQLHLASQKELLWVMADGVYNNRANLGKEIFGSDVLRHLIVPSTGNIIGQNYDEYGRDTAGLGRRLQSPSSLARALFTSPNMDEIEGMQEESLLKNLRTKFIGRNSGKISGAELEAKVHMRNVFNRQQADFGTAVHDVMAHLFGLDSKELSDERRAELKDNADKAHALIEPAAYNQLTDIMQQVKKALVSRYGTGLKFHPELVLASTKKGLFGRIDLLVELPSGHYAIVDFKVVNESLFSKDGKTFSKKYTRINGGIKLPKLAATFTYGKGNLYKLHRALSTLPNSKLRHHQLQAITYKTLVEDQKNSNSSKPVVDEVIVVPIVKKASPSVVLTDDENKNTVIDKEQSKWSITELSMDRDVVTLYSTRLTGTSTPDGSTTAREQEIQKNLVELVDSVGMQQLSKYSPTVYDNIDSAIPRADPVAAKLAYEAVDFVQLAIGKSLKEITSMDVQDMLGIGYAELYYRAQQNILNAAEKLEVTLPESYMNQLKHEQIYWTALGEYLPDMSDVEGGSLKRTDRHSNEHYRFVRVKNGKTNLRWIDNTSKMGDAELKAHHFGKPLLLTMNGGMQQVLFKEYGLSELGGKIVEGSTIMLPPTLLSDPSKSIGVEHTALFGRVVKVYSGDGISVEVTNDDGSTTQYYLSDTVENRKKNTDGKMVHVTDSYGIYLVEAAKGTSYTENEDALNSQASIRTVTMEDWKPSYTEQVDELTSMHFAPAKWATLVNGEYTIPDEQIQRSMTGLWEVFDTLPTNRNMLSLFTDSQENIEGEKNSFGANTRDIDHVYNILCSHTPVGKTEADDPAKDMIAAVQAAIFAYTMANDIREEATVRSSTLPKFTMYLHNMARNTLVGNALSIDDLHSMVERIGIKTTTFKLPRLIGASYYGVNFFKEHLADAYNESQGMIRSYTLEYNLLVEAVQKAGYSLNDIMYQRPSAKYERTRPWVFKSTDDDSIKNRKPLLDLLKFMERTYRNTQPGFTTIGGKLVPLTDMGTSELGSRAMFWRSRFVDLFSSKAWDSEKVALPNDQNTTKTLRQWKREYLERYNDPKDLMRHGLLGGFWQHVKYRTYDYGTHNFDAYSSSDLHYLDAQARKQWERIDDNKKGLAEQRKLRLAAVQRSANNQSLIPTQNIEISLRASIKTSITASMMGKVSPIANFMYDKHTDAGQDGAAEFVYGQLAMFYPGFKPKDDNPWARLLRTGAYLTSLQFLGFNINAQQLNFYVGQLNDFLHSPRAFREGWQMFISNPRKAIRVLKYYKVISITEDFAYHPEDSTEEAKWSKRAMAVMQGVENMNHVILVLGMLGRRAFDNLDSSMTNEVDANGRDTGRPKRKLQYQVAVNEDNRDAVIDALRANGAVTSDMERTAEAGGFVWCANIDLPVVAGIVGRNVQELRDEAAYTRSNDIDLPSSAEISRILMADVGQAQGDYRKTLHNNFQSTPYAVAMVMFRRFYFAAYSNLVMSSHRDSNFELMVSAKDRIASDFFYLFGYRFASTEKRTAYLRKAVDQLMGYNMQHPEQFSMLHMEGKYHTNSKTVVADNLKFKGRQLAAIMVLGKLVQDIMTLNNANVNLKDFYSGKLSQEEMDRLLERVAKDGGRRSPIMAKRALNTALMLSFAALMKFVIFRPGDDEKDAGGKEMLTLMPWWKRNLYLLGTATFEGMGAQFFMPSKLDRTYQLSPTYSYLKEIFGGAYDNQQAVTLFERMASTPDGHTRADMADQVVSRIPMVSRLYRSANSVAEGIHPVNGPMLEEHQKALMAAKYKQQLALQYWKDLEENDPEKFKELMGILGSAKATKEAAMASFYDQLKSSGKIEFNQTVFDVSSSRRDAMIDAYENELKNQQK